jgi:hypothetical protein
LLGGQQSGHIDAVGFDMYVQLLENTIRELKGEELEDDARAAVSLGVSLRISEDYVPDMNQRLTVYRRVAASRTMDELTRALDEISDRYGPLPPSVLHLAGYGRIRVAAHGAEPRARCRPVVVGSAHGAGRSDPPAERGIRGLGRACPAGHAEDGSRRKTGPSVPGRPVKRSTGRQARQAK